MNQEDAPENERLVQEMLQSWEQCVYAQVLKQIPTTFYKDEDLFIDVVKKSIEVGMQKLRDLIKAGDAKREADERKGANDNGLYDNIPGTKELRKKISKYLDADIFTECGDDDPATHDIGVLGWIDIDLQPLYGDNKHLRALRSDEEFLRHSREISLVGMYELMIAAEQALPAGDGGYIESCEIDHLCHDFARGLAEHFRSLFTETVKTKIRKRGLMKTAIRMLEPDWYCGDY